jgi:hypothetical protein
VHVLRLSFLWFEPFGDKLQFYRFVDIKGCYSSCLHLVRAELFGSRERHLFPLLLYLVIL